MTASNAEKPSAEWSRQRRRCSLDEQALERDVQPIGSGEAYAREDIFASDEELDEFLAFLYESRRAGVA